MKGVDCEKKEKEKRIHRSVVRRARERERTRRDAFVVVVVVALFLEKEGERKKEKTLFTEERERRFEVDAVGHEDVVGRVGDSFWYRCFSPVENGSDHVGFE